MDIGIFGGTFNPIHNGHLIVAEKIRAWFGLSRIYFIPSFSPPHKEGPVLEAEHRLNMVRLAIEKNPNFLLSPLEIERGGSSYTIDTIREMRETLGEGPTLYFIIGADAFREISTWKDYRSLLRMLRFIVISRPKVDIGVINPDLTDIIKDKDLRPVAKSIIDGFETPEAIKGGDADIFFMHVPQIDISSTDIRESVKKGISIRYQVPEGVARYIEANRLYSS